MVSNYCKCANVLAVLSIKLKFNKRIIGHHPTYFIDFDNFRINNFFIRLQKRILLHYGQLSQIIRSMLDAKWYSQLN